MKGYHIVNKDALKEAKWEEINYNIVNSVEPPPITPIDFKTKKRTIKTTPPPTMNMILPPSPGDGSSSNGGSHIIISTELFFNFSFLLYNLHYKKF